MASVAKFDGIEIPKIIDINESYNDGIEDAARTADATLRKMVVGVKRTWEITTAKITKSEADALIDMLNLTMHGAGEFWIDDFGPETNTVTAYLKIESNKRTPFGDARGWHPDGRQLTIKVTEK